ncbi:MAG: PAS domain S-box protein [Desulfobacterales bacterium]|jgi:PAS domain S-box-containing protein|nr:PAS domain S-box protein [Desulfobacterales bacterium]
MSLRTKIGIILAIAVAGFCLTQFLVQHYVVLPGFLSLEREEALKDLHRVEAAIQSEVDQVDSFCGDWSSWDDTYDYVLSLSAEYSNSNLVYSSFLNNDLNLIYICDNTARVIWGGIFDLTDQSPIDLSLFPADHMPQAHPLFEGSADPASIQFMKKGILMTEKGPLILSARPILTSNEGGPSRGILIMGRFFTDSLKQRLACQTQVEYDILPISDAHVSPQDRKALSRLNAQTPHWMDDADTGCIKTHALYPDINEKPALLLTVQTPRSIAHKGHETVRIAIYSVMLAGLGILLMVLLSLQQTILTPLAGLTQHALAVRQSGDYSKRLALTGKDEIGVLSREFDNMLAHVEKTSRTLAEINAQLQHDIEIRRQVAADLKESEERFKAMVDQAADAVFLNNRDGRIRMVNQVACRRLGYETQELLEMNLFDIDPNFLNRSERNQLFDQLSHQTPVIFEAKHRRKDGTSFPVEITVSPIQYKGEDLFLSIARDISQRKQLELRLRYADKMDALRTLTAGIAHNFNNILSIIFGSAGLAKQYIAEDSAAFNLIHKIETASMRAREIVWQLISFSNPASEHLTPLHIHQLIGDVLEKLEASKPNNIRIVKYIQPDCSPVLGNAKHFHQMMTNLWENAIEALSNGGGDIEIRIEDISFITVSPDMGPDFKPGNYVKIMMADNGRGIDPSTLQSIFDPFFSTKDFSTGAGMGLSVVHGIVKSHAGFITVNSKPGEGTRIILVFPAVQT